MTISIQEAVIHYRALVPFTESLQTESDTLVGEWENNVCHWELDPLNSTCPYYLLEESKLCL